LDRKERMVRQGSRDSMDPRETQDSQDPLVKLVNLGDLVYQDHLDQMDCQVPVERTVDLVWQVSREIPGPLQPLDSLDSPGTGGQAGEEGSREHQGSQALREREDPKDCQVPVRLGSQVNPVIRDWTGSRVSLDSQETGVTLGSQDLLE